MDAPTPGLADAFELLLIRGTPIDVGAIATGGRRSHVPVTGGTFVGEGLAGEVRGGGELQLARNDGVITVEANYYIAFADGAVARCFGTGYRTNSAEFTGMRLSLLFEAAEDTSVASLATRAFLAEQKGDEARLAISRIV